jgi:hypothetical protein
VGMREDRGFIGSRVVVSGGHLGEELKCRDICRRSSHRRGCRREWTRRPCPCPGRAATARPTAMSAPRGRRSPRRNSIRRAAGDGPALPRPSGRRPVRRRQPGPGGNVASGCVGALAHSRSGQRTRRVALPRGIIQSAVKPVMRRCYRRKGLPNNRPIRRLQAWPPGASTTLCVQCPARATAHRQRERLQRSAWPQPELGQIGAQLSAHGCGRGRRAGRGVAGRRW